MQKVLGLGFVDFSVSVLLEFRVQGSSPLNPYIPPVSISFSISFSMFFSI